MLFRLQRSHPYPLARNKRTGYVFFDTRRSTPGTVGAAWPILGSHSSKSGFPQELLNLVLSTGSPGTLDMSSRGPPTGPRDSMCPTWVQDLHNFARQLPAAEVAFLNRHIHSRPLTTDVILASTLRSVETYERKWFHQTLRKLDPLLSHIKSFSSIADIFVQTNPRIPCLIWGSLHLAITVWSLESHLIKRTYLDLHMYRFVAGQWLFSKVLSACLRNSHRYCHSFGAHASYSSK